MLAPTPLALPRQTELPRALPVQPPDELTQRAAVHPESLGGSAEVDEQRPGWRELPLRCPGDHDQPSLRRAPSDNGRSPVTIGERKLGEDPSLSLNQRPRRSGGPQGKHRHPGAIRQG